MLNIWEYNIKQKMELQIVVPMVVYHGKSKWQKNIFNERKLAMRLKDFIGIGKLYFREEEGLKFLDSVLRYLFSSTEIIVSNLKIESASMAVNDRHVRNKAAFIFHRDKPQRLFYMFLIEPLLIKAKNSVTRRVLRLKVKQILEVGCGTCLQSLKIAQAGIKVVGVDISDKMFPSAPDIPEELTIQVADGTNLPFPDHSFDLTLISLALHEMAAEKRLSIIKELIRTLRPGGTVLILDYDTGIKKGSGLTSWLIKAIEWFAGKEHHANFRDFLRKGGVAGLLAILGYRVSRRFPVLNGMAAIFEVAI